MIEWLLNNCWWILGIFIFVIVVLFFCLARLKGRILYSRDFDIQFEHRKSSRFDTDPDFLRYKKVEEKPEWYHILIDELKRLPFGKIMFNPPSTMKLGIQERIEARITQDPKVTLTKSLKGRGVPQVEDIKVSELMKVRLTGSAFDITFLNEEEQIVEPSGYTEWAWDVNPNKAGIQTLYLHVSLRIRLPFGEEKKDHPVLEREILVAVNPVYSAKVFLSTYWKWIVTALLIPLLVWLWNTYIKGS